MISFDEIQSILKQKSPFIFVDRVIEHEKGKRIVSIKNVTGSEMFSSFQSLKLHLYYARLHMRMNQVINKCNFWHWEG